MLNVNALKEYGANTDEAVKRCMNNEAFYIRMVKMAVADKNFDKLPAAIEAQDWKGAFEAAHALKGVLGNLALTPMLTPAQKLTEIFRPQTAVEPAEYEELLAAIAEQKAKLEELING